MTLPLNQPAAKLGAHHLAHLAAVVEGMSIEDAARRYLGIHANAAANTHRHLVSLVQALARRRGDTRAELMPLDGRDRESDGVPAALEAPALPSLDAWAAERGYDEGWREEELLEMYQAEFGGGKSTPAPSEVPAVRTRQQRMERRRRELREFLVDVERYDVECAKPSDLVEGWFAASISRQWRALGVLTLDELRVRIARGGRWWSDLHAVGPVKAARMAQLLATLLPETPAATWPVDRAAGELARFSGQDGANRVRDGRPGRLSADDDRAAMRVWIGARAGSRHTALQYERELERAMLWAVLERHKALSDLTAEDCRAFMDFLAAVPERWISRRKAARLAPGWAPFKGPLSLASQRVAIDVVSGWFAWAVRARYLVDDPWQLVNRRLGDDPLAAFEDPTSRAFTPEGWNALLAHLARPPRGPSRDRLQWVCEFVQRVGLRADELVRSKRGDLTRSAEGWIIRVHGKGRRNREVPVPASAMKATRLYFARRGLDFDSAAQDVPLLENLGKGAGHVGYRSFAESFTRLAKRVGRDPAVPAEERERIARASAHWLRHTYATRCAEGEIGVDVLMENLGQSDPRVTAKYFRAQIKRRQREVERVFSQ